MLLVKTKIGPSKISGIGLFADQFIKKGTTIWKFQHSIDVASPDGEEMLDVADRDIEKREELTCNYKDFDEDFDYKMSVH